MTDSGFRWVVIRLAPRSYGRNELHWFDPPEAERTSGVPVRAFDSEQAATECRDRLEREARETALFGLFVDSLLPEALGELLGALASGPEPAPDLTALGPPVLPVRVSPTQVSYTPELHAYSERAAVLIREWSRTIRPDTNAALWDELFPENYFYAVVDVPVEE